MNNYRKFLQEKNDNFLILDDKLSIHAISGQSLQYLNF